MKRVAQLANKKWHRCCYWHIFKWVGRKKETVVVVLAMTGAVVAHCQVHAQATMPAPQINFIFFFFFFFVIIIIIFVFFFLLLFCFLQCSSRYCSPALRAFIIILKIVVWLTRAFSSLRAVRARPNLVVHSNWPLLHIYTNGDVDRLKERREGDEEEEEDEEEKQENSF